MLLFKTRSRRPRLCPDMLHALTLYVCFPFVILQVDDPSHKVHWLDLEAPLVAAGLSAEAAKDFYLARVNWMPDNTVAVQIENREQTELYVVRFDPASGSFSLLLKEESPVWINLHNIFDCFEWADAPPALLAEHGIQRTKGDFFFLWASERTGFRHLYLYYFNAAKNGGHAQEVLQITDGDWMVEGIVRVHQVSWLCVFVVGWLVGWLVGCVYVCVCVSVYLLLLSSGLVYLVWCLVAPCVVCNLLRQWRRRPCRIRTVMFQHASERTILFAISCVYTNSIHTYIHTYIHTERRIGVLHRNQRQPVGMPHIRYGAGEAH
jgi:hypothetical protein